MEPPAAAIAARRELLAEGTGETGDVTEVQHDAWECSQEQCGNTGDDQSNLQ